MYEIVWEFRAQPNRIAEFEAAYGPGGSWAHLFQNSEGFIETRLLHDREEKGRYLTLDRWASPDAFEAFMRDHREAYEALDRALEGLCADERRIGVFSA